MKNNNGKGLYDIGEHLNLSCGCAIVAEEVGYTHYIHHNCHFDNVSHGKIPHYNYKMLSEIINKEK